MKTCCLTPPTPHHWVYVDGPALWRGYARVIVVVSTPSPAPSSACSLVKGRFSFAHDHGGAGSDRQTRRRGTETDSLFTVDRRLGVTFRCGRPIEASPSPRHQNSTQIRHLLFLHTMNQAPTGTVPLLLTPGAPATVPAHPLDNCCATLVVRFPRWAERNAISVSRPMEAACTNSPPDPHYPGTWHPKLLSLDAPHKAKA